MSIAGFKLGNNFPKTWSNQHVICHIPKQVYTKRGPFRLIQNTLKPKGGPQSPNLK